MFLRTETCRMHNLCNLQGSLSATIVASAPFVQCLGKVVTFPYCVHPACNVNAILQGGQCGVNAISRGGQDGARNITRWTRWCARNITRWCAHNITRWCAGKCSASSMQRLWQFALTAAAAVICCLNFLFVATTCPAPAWPNHPAFKLH